MHKKYFSINGRGVASFGYDEIRNQVNFYDFTGRTICTVSMSKEEWKFNYEDLDYVEQWNALSDAFSD